MIEHWAYVGDKIPAGATVLEIEGITRVKYSVPDEPHKHSEAMRAASNLNWSPENPDKPIEEILGIPPQNLETKCIGGAEHRYIDNFCPLCDAEKTTKTP